MRGAYQGGRRHRISRRRRPGHRVGHRANPVRALSSLVPGPWRAPSGTDPWLSGRRHPVNDPVRTMRAMRAASADPASLTCEDIPVPEAGPGELLVEVRATAITAGELTWPEGWPAIPCHDLSGTVAATGHGVTGWRPGDDVYGLVGFDRPGAAANYVTAPPRPCPKPVSVDHLAPPPFRSAPSRPGRRCTSTRGCGLVSMSWCTAAPARGCLRRPARGAARRPGDRHGLRPEPRLRRRARRT